MVDCIAQLHHLNLVYVARSMVEWLKVLSPAVAMVELRGTVISYN
jgi:hypothetical protein